MDSHPAGPPAPDAPARHLPAVPGYRVLREIARGGMGRVLAAHDLTLDRAVALKVLLPGASADRFLRESKITARLPHPGIPPVHALGTLADGSPFLAMKLIAGQTLADELKTADRPRLLQAFTQVCQAVGFAHSRGIIHRDLKPSNVMVGAFGEVQVMDWGLARDLTSLKVADEPSSSVAPPVPRDSTDDQTQAGQVLGTPSYMAPEQARGEAADARADVFALGGILCAILTGQPPFVGKSAPEVIQRAGAADLAEALARLDGCGADAELVALCRRCLSPSPLDRPADGQAVADELTAYLNGAQERLQTAERERAVAVVRASEERRRRRVQLVLLGSVLALLTLGGLSTAYYLQQRQARAAAVERVVGQVETLLDQARAQPEDLSRWQVALAAVKQAEAGGEASAHDRLPELRTKIQAGLDAAQRDRALQDRLIDIRSAQAHDLDGSATDRDYADAFRKAGIDLALLTPAEAGAKIRARTPSVALALAGALDDWAAIRRGKRADAAGSARLSAAARVADPDPWRNGLRNVLDQSDQAAARTALRALAKTANFDELGPVSLHLLGALLFAAGDSALAESVLRTAQQRHPRDVWVNYTLGKVLEARSRRDEAIRFYTAARAIRPEIAVELAHALEDRGDSAEALAVLRDLKGLRPGNARVLGSLGMALEARGRSREAREMFDAAVAASREAIRLHPDDAVAHGNLGVTLFHQGKLAEAIAAYRTAIRLRPNVADFHCGLALALENQGKRAEAIGEYRTAIRLKPDLADAHLGLGVALGKQGKVDEAIAAYRTAIRLKPDLAKAHVDLGAALFGQGKRDEAIAAYRTAIRLRPDLAVAHNNLGIALVAQRKPDEAVAAFRTAIRLKPNDAIAHLGLGSALLLQGKHGEAVAEYRTAIRLKPDFANAHLGLGGALFAQGKLEEALASFRRAGTLAPPGSAVAQGAPGMIRTLEQQLGLSARLPAVLTGEDRPRSPTEGLAFARMAHDRKQFAAATRLWAEALANDPKLGDNRQTSPRYNAACAAALAAAGQGKEEQPLDGAARARLRRQALDWLKAELLAWGKALDSGPPQARPFLVKTLSRWQQDSDLAGLRDRAALAKLPAEERVACTQLWADVAALQKKAEEKPK
jgi:eukaryotic-like serine/threonine-protein kinase